MEFISIVEVENQRGWHNPVFLRGQNYTIEIDRVIYERQSLIAFICVLFASFNQKFNFFILCFRLCFYATRK